MELEKCGDADQCSIEMQTALKRFDDLYNSLDDEQTKLLELEKRRQKLKEDLERLRTEIKKEKDHFRSVIDEQIAGEPESDNQNYENEQLRELAEPISLDTGAIKEFIENQRDELAFFANETDIESLKDKLEKYEIDYSEENPDETITSQLTADQMGLDKNGRGDARIDPAREDD